jgi:hypothetical protein
VKPRLSCATALYFEARETEVGEFSDQLAHIQPDQAMEFLNPFMLRKHLVYGAMLGAMNGDMNVYGQAIYGLNYTVCMMELAQLMSIVYFCLG